jgi:nitrogen fixation/metabolism regulation signal transduction histidine kinase
MNAEIVLRLESSFRQEDTEQLFERALAAIVEDVQDIKQMMKEMTGPPRAGSLAELGRLYPPAKGEGSK